jgi:hypothetical protein
LAKNGSVAAWARRLGYQPRRPGGQRRWTEERIRTELSAFVAGETAFPSRTAFYKAGRGDLYGAAGVYRGVAWWRHEFGFVARGKGRPLVWSDQRIEAELRALVVDGRFPSQAAFAEAGKLPVYWAIARHHGVKLWAARTGAAIEALVCESCGASFERERTRGRKPKTCPVCRGLTTPVVSS